MLQNKFKFNCGIVIIFFLIILLFPYMIKAVNIEAEVGFNGGIVSQRWNPVTIELENKGEDFSGKLVIQVKFRKITSSRDDFKELDHIIPITIPEAGARTYRTQIFYTKDYFSPVSLKILKNDKIIKEEKIYLPEIIPEYKELLVVDSLSERDSASYGQRRQKSLNLRPDYLPETWTVYQGISTIIIGNFALTELNLAQQEALRRWFLTGKNIIVSGDSFNKRINSHFIEQNIAGSDVRQFNYIVENEDFLSSSESVMIYTTNDLLKENKLNYFLNPTNYFKTNSGFLDNLTEEMFKSISYWRPSNIIILLTIILFCLFLTLLQYFFKKYKDSLFLFSLFFIIIVTIITGIVYFGTGNLLISRNHKLQEYAIIEKSPSASVGQVESYYTFLSRKLENPVFSINKKEGSISDFLPYYDFGFEQDYNIIIDEMTNIINYRKKGNWLAGGFRANYLKYLPVFFEKNINYQNLKINIENLSLFTIENVFIYYNDQWFYSEENEEIIIDLKSDYLLGSPWNQNILVDIKEEILRQISIKRFSDEITKDNDFSYIVCILSNESQITSLNSEGNWQEEFNGILIVPLYNIN